MNIYRYALMEYPDSDGREYAIYIRFNKRVCPEQLAKQLNRKIKDFGSDKNNSLSMIFFYKNRCENFMLEMKRLILKDPDIREVRIQKVL